MSIKISLTVGKTEQVLLKDGDKTCLVATGAMTHTALEISALLTTKKGHWYCRQYGGREVIRRYYGLDRESLLGKTPIRQDEGTGRAAAASGSAG